LTDGDPRGTSISSAGKERQRGEKEGKKERKTASIALIQLSSAKMGDKKGGGRRKRRPCSRGNVRASLFPSERKEKGKEREKDVPSISDHVLCLRSRKRDRRERAIYLALDYGR